MTAMTVADLGEIFDGPHATPKRRDEGPYFLNISSLANGHLDLDQSDHLSTEDFRNWTKRVTPRAGDLLFSYETRLGAAALMPARVQACLGRRMALIRPDRSRVLPRYLLYFYLSPGFQRIIESNTVHGATVSRIPLNRMGRWPIDLPPLPEQQAIAEVLGALDDKIAANRRVLVSLDGLVRARYLHELAGATTFVSLCDVAESVRRQVSPGDIAADATYVGLEHIPRKRMWIDSRGSGADVTSAKNQYQDGDVLFGKLRPYFHKVAHASRCGMCSTDILVIRARDEVARGLVLGACTADTTVAVAIAGSEGTRMPRAKWADIAAVEIPSPEQASVRQFSRYVMSCASAADAHVLENEHLAATRDALLPLLMSGKVRVNDVEDEVGELV